VRFAPVASQVRNGDFRNSCPVQGGKRRNEAVQFAVEMQIGEDFPAVGLEGCSEVVQCHSRDFCHEPVGNAGGEGTGEKGIGT